MSQKEEGNQSRERCLTPSKNSCIPRYESSWGNAGLGDAQAGALKTAKNLRLISNKSLNLFFFFLIFIYERKPIHL